jgi:FixJ family two-component response regulator
MRIGVRRLIKVHGFEAKLFDSIEDFDRGAKLDDAICLVLDITRTAVPELNCAAGSQLPGIRCR